MHRRTGRSRNSQAMLLGRGQFPPRICDCRPRSDVDLVWDLKLVKKKRVLRQARLFAASDNAAWGWPPGQKGGD